MKYRPFMLVGLMIAVAGLAAAFVGTSFTLNSVPDEVYDGVVVSREVMTVEVPAGNRKTKQAERVRIMVDYKADTTKHSLQADRAPELAEALTVGAPVLVYGKGEAASLIPEGSPLGLVLTFGGVFVFFFGSLAIFVGWVASRRTRAH